MVHCVSSSEPDSGDNQVNSDEWRNGQGNQNKDVLQTQTQLTKTYVESTVTSGIQVGNFIEQVGTHQLTLTDIQNNLQPDTTHSKKMSLSMRYIKAQ